MPVDGCGSSGIHIASTSSATTPQPHLLEQWRILLAVGLHLISDLHLLDILLGYHHFLNMIQVKLSPVVKQLLASTSASMMLMATVSTWAFSAIALPQMALPGSSVNFSTEQASWFGPLCEKVGPRRLMLALSPVLCATTALIGTASWQVVQEAVSPELFLLVIRVLQGGVQAVLFPAVLIYIYEVCDGRRRGTMVSAADFWATFSFPLSYLAGCLLEWPVLAWLMSFVILVPAFIGLLVSPESPAWMLRKKKERDALKSLSQLRSSEDEISDEVRVITETSQTDANCYQLLQVLKKKSNTLAIIFVAVMMVLKEMTGISVLNVFMVKIFKVSGVGLDPCLSSVISGFTQMLIKTFSLIIIHYSPRKPLLVVGTILTAAGTASLGAFYFLQSSGADVSWLWWLPLLGVVVFMVGYAGAVGCATWTVFMEVLPGPARSLGLSSGTAAFAVTAFTLSKTFENGEPTISLHGMFWLYTAGSVAYCIFIALFFTETRGRTLLDIEEYWESFNN